MSTKIIENDGVLTGPFKKPFNEAMNVANSIHNDETAMNLGLKGGTIAGSIHFEQFVPLFLEAFGQRWFETGSISMYFRNATTHQEPVKCFMNLPQAGDNVQSRIWMEDEKGILVGEGTASIGSPDEPSALRDKLDKLYPPGNVRILKYLEKGMEIPAANAMVDLERNQRRQEIITEPLDWYVEDSPWGGPILTPSGMVEILREDMKSLEAARHSSSNDPVVGLFGALEFRYIKGPVLCDKTYINHGKIAAVGETPKTEYYWHEGVLEDAHTGDRMAESILMSRVMKASSMLYPELR